MRVLHLISSGGMYGAEAVILNLCSVLNATPGDHSMIGVFGNSGQPIPELHAAALRAGVESHVLACRGQLDRTTSEAIRNLQRASSADIVHAHGYKADVYGWLAFRRTETPLVSTCHTWYDNDLAVRLYGALDRQILKRFHGVVAVSDQVRDRLLAAGVRPQRIRLIRNGIELHAFADAPSKRAQRRSAGGPLKIGLVGRLSPEKGVDILIDAAAEVVRRAPGTQFVVAGDGPDRAALEGQILRLGLHDNVLLAGRTNDMAAFYASVDVLVSASREEGLPIALLEGMGSGLPVVATSVGAVPQIIENATPGCWSARAMCRLWPMPSARSSMTRACAFASARQVNSASRMSSQPDG